VLQFLIVLAILAAVVLVVTAPIRRPRAARAMPLDREVERESGQAVAESSDVAELEAARDAKYREIRDAELDHRTGKLSDADFEAVDGGLRAEAIQILNALDRARGGSGAADRTESAESAESAAGAGGRRGRRLASAGGGGSPPPGADSPQGGSRPG
jgi:hypothetical protein